MTIADLTTAGPIATHAPHQRKPYPDGWQPRSEVDTASGGYVVTKPFEVGHEPDHADALTEFGLDPQQWAVSSVRRSRWQKYDGDWLESVRINVVPVGANRSDVADHDAMLAAIGKWRPASGKNRTANTNFGTFVAPAGDLQLGKSDGTGSPGTVNRFLAETNAVCGRLRKAVYSRSGTFRRHSARRTPNVFDREPGMRGPVRRSASQK